MTRNQAAALAKLFANRVTSADQALGMWTFPYKKPRGTKAACVIATEGDIVHLSDGTSMHFSRVQEVAQTAVAA